MKQSILCIFLSLTGWAQRENSTKVVDSKISNVVVYESGAQVTRTFKTPLAMGRTTLTLRNVSPQLDPQSIQVQSNANVVIMSVVHQSSFLSDDAKNTEQKKLETQKKGIEDKIAYEKAMLNVFKQEEGMLYKNQEMSGRSAVLKAIDLKDAVDFHRSRLTEVALKQLEIQKNIKKFDDEILLINVELTLLSPNQEATASEIVVVAEAKEAVTQAEFSTSYFVPNAGWTPTYDLRVRDVAHPLELAYKANVYQYSGEDWNNVNLTLSTANPRKNGENPTLRPWYWGFPNDYSDYHNRVNTQTNTNTNEIVGTVRAYESKEALPGVTVLLKGTSLGTRTDENGNYRLAIPPNLKNTRKELVFSMIGFVSQERNVNQNTINVSLVEDQRALAEVVVVGEKSQIRRDVTGAMSIVTKSRNQTLEVEENEAPTSLAYSIKLPYNVPSDGKVYAVEIKNEEIDAYYEYITVPKIDRDVFLTAQILDWSKYNLLEGDISLFFEGTFVGKSTLKLPDNDTLTLSLGRDKSVLVNRIKRKDFTRTQLIGSNKTESRTYDISIKNTKKQPINVVVKDQFPVSNSKNIEITNQVAKEADWNTETGEITWRLKLAAAQDKKLEFGYQAKYPKSGVVVTE